MPYRSPSPNDADLMVFRGWLAATFLGFVFGIALLIYADGSFWGVVRGVAGGGLLVAACFAARRGWDNP